MPKTLIWNQATHGTYVKALFGQIGRKAMPPTEQQLQNRAAAKRYFSRVVKQRAFQPPNKAKKPLNLRLKELFSKAGAKAGNKRKKPNWIIRLIQKIKQFIHL